MQTKDRTKYVTENNVAGNKSSSSSCRAASTDIPDPLSPLLPIIHRLQQVFRVTSCVPHIVAVCKFVLVVLLLHIHMWGVHRSTSLMSSSLLLQQCPTCLEAAFILSSIWKLRINEKDLFAFLRNLRFLLEDI